MDEGELAQSQRARAGDPARKTGSVEAGLTFRQRESAGEAGSLYCAGETKAHTSERVNVE